MAKAKPIFIPGTSQQFASAAAAAKALGIDAGNITKVLKGKRKSAGGYSFGYASNRTIYIPETGQTFSDIKVAARAVKVSPKKVEHIIENNVGKTVGGYHFEYVDASKIMPVTTSDSRSSATTKKNRKAKKQARQQQKRQQKQAKLERQLIKETQIRKERKERPNNKPKGKGDIYIPPYEKDYLDARVKLQDYLKKVNDKIAEYKALHENYIYYNPSAPAVLGLQMIMGGTNDGYFDTTLSQFKLSYDSPEEYQKATEQLERWLQRIEAETNKGNGRFWDIRIASGNRQAFALEFNITTTQMDAYAYLIWDMFSVFNKANENEELGSDLVYHAVKDAMQGSIPAYKLAEFLENIDAYMDGSKAQELDDIFAILDGYEPPDDSVWNDEGWVI